MFHTFDETLHEARVPHNNVVLVLARGLGHRDHEIAFCHICEEEEKGEREREEFPFMQQSEQRMRQRRRVEEKKSIEPSLFSKRPRETPLFGVVCSRALSFFRLSLPSGHVQPLL